MKTHLTIRLSSFQQVYNRCCIEQRCYITRVNKLLQLLTSFLLITHKAHDEEPRNQSTYHYLTVY